MHSSTSSFRPLPHAWRSLALAAVLAVTWLAGYELFWRSRGFAPTLTNSEQLWCETRARVSPLDVVIVGSSRAQRGLDPQLLSRALEGRGVVQLAIDGGNAFPVLADLARDPGFAGTVLVEYMPKRWLVPDSAGTTRTQGFLSACASPSLVASIEGRLDRELERRFVFLSPELQLITVLSYIGHQHALPHDSRDILRSDRFLEEHFANRKPSFDPDIWEPPLAEAQLAARLADLHRSVMAIRARGGCVVVYRSPVADAGLRDEEEHFPAHTWLPRVVEALGAAEIDFESIPELRDVPLPDGSHPDATQVPTITRAVAARLRTVLDTCQPPPK